MTAPDLDAHALAGAYVCDALTPAEVAALERHVAVRATCAQELDPLREADVLRRR
jgi:hypothetical protein